MGSSDAAAPRERRFAKRREWRQDGADDRIIGRQGR
jgi:hypothetical protein